MDFLMEVTPKTRADVKGGTIIAHGGRAKLLEIAQVPPAHTRDFESITTFRIFNTNNLWVRIAAIPPLVASGKLLDSIDVIVNKKPYCTHQVVIQLEIAAGAAIQYFDHAGGVRVPRSRFLPVKGTTDLLTLGSNIHTLHAGSLTLNPQREALVGTTALPTVRLSAEFRRVADFLRRFQTIPDMLELESLTVSGDVCFGRDVRLKGNVTIVAPPGCHIDIPSGSVLENKLVQGNVLIADL
jgi:UTP--glucose-1-phosphate uridylyltransferase